MSEVHNLNNPPNLSKEHLGLDQSHELAQIGLQVMKLRVEIFMEIASYVHPGDLISLIRTAKFLRAILLDRSAAPV
ncbi:hypothetical protein RSAG8_06877, partial [Rhizoctonia solani AG-8 WAC10335]